MDLYDQIILKLYNFFYLKYMANLTIVDKILEILRANLCSIERSENTVVIYKRP